jgi:hypothetical protein
MIRLNRFGWLLDLLANRILSRRPAEKLPLQPKAGPKLGNLRISFTD